MKCSIHWIIVTLFCLFTLGCKSEDPNPELLDPIYKDLLSATSEYEKQTEEQKAHRTELELYIQTAEPNSIDLAKARIDLAKTLRVQRESEEKARYYRIRAARRLVESRLAYKKAFHADLKWPDPAEYSGYLVNKRLNEVNLNWNAQVPKLQDRIPANEGKSAEKPAAAAH